MTEAARGLAWAGEVLAGDALRCDYRDAGACRSCTVLGRPYAEQLAAKDAHARATLAAVPGAADAVWLEPVASAPLGFRNKAKMVVGGTVDAPTLGILDDAGRGVDLQGCGMHAPALRAVLPAVARFVTLARLTPYDVPSRRGELKHVLLTRSPDDELMLRLVLRSQEPVARLRKHLPVLLAEVPGLRVVSANIQPAHAAVLEGELEIPLTDAETLRMRVNDLDLHLRPQSFFQTNTPVAAALYRQGAAWVAEATPSSVWDLYCGVGGFALHVAAPGRHVTGIEVAPEAIASARRSAAQAGLTDVSFAVGDATAFAVGADAPPDLVIVNPPRRGIGAELAGWLERSGVRDVVYSSCNAASLARDLAAMPSLRATHARVLDMFPQTDHYEVITRLTRH